MQALLIITIIVLYTLQTLFCTLFDRKYKGREDLSSSVFCILQGAFIVVFTLVWMAFDINASPSGFSAEWIGFNFSPSFFTIAIGILNATVLFGYNTALIKAGAKGSYAFMNVAMLFGGILIPAIYEMFTGHALELYHYIAIVVMFIAFILMNYTDMKFKGTTLLYYVYCFILALCNGLYGTFLKIQSVYAENENNEMIIITFGGMGLIALIQLALKEKKQMFSAFKMGKAAVLPMILCFIVAATAINVYMILIPLLGNVVTILYTLDNGGVLVLSAISSVIFFKEKMNSFKLVGIILSVLGIITLALNTESLAAIKELLS